MTLLTTSFGGIGIDPRLAVVLLIAVAAIFITNLITKAVKKNKTTKAFAALTRGDKLVLCNGMTGTFLSKGGDTVEIGLSSGARARFMEWVVLEINGKKYEHLDRYRRKARFSGRISRGCGNRFRHRSEIFL